MGPVSFPVSFSGHHMHAVQGGTQWGTPWTVCFTMQVKQSSQTPEPLFLHWPWGDFWSIMSCQRPSSLAVMQKDTMSHVSELLAHLKGRWKVKKVLLLRHCTLVHFFMPLYCSLSQNCQALWLAVFKARGQKYSSLAYYKACLMPTTKLALSNIMQLNSK